MRALILLCAAFTSLSTGAVAAPKPEKAPAALAESDRSIAGGRAVRLGIEQNWIETTIDLGRVAATPSDGGLIGAIIIGEKDADRRRRMRGSLREKTEATVGPLRQALDGFDVNALALATTKAALARLDWFQAQEITSSKQPSDLNFAAFVAASPTAQSAFISYRYELSPDLSQIRVIADITLARKPATRSGKAASAPQVIYRQRISSIVQLATRSYENHQNVASWSADGGKLGRAALTAAFAQLEQLIPYVFGLGQPEINAFTTKTREKAFAGGFYGPLITRGKDTSNGVLIWANGFVHVQDIS